MKRQSHCRNRTGRLKKKRWKDNLREGLGRHDLKEIEGEDKEQWMKRMKEIFG